MRSVPRAASGAGATLAVPVDAAAAARPAPAPCRASPTPAPPNCSACARGRAAGPGAGRARWHRCRWRRRRTVSAGAGRRRWHRRELHSPAVELQLAELQLPRRRRGWHWRRRAPRRRRRRASTTQQVPAAIAIARQRARRAVRASAAETMLRASRSTCRRHRAAWTRTAAARVGAACLRAAAARPRLDVVERELRQAPGAACSPLASPIERCQPTRGLRPRRTSLREIRREPAQIEPAAAPARRWPRGRWPRLRAVQARRRVACASAAPDACPTTSGAPAPRPASARCCSRKSMPSSTQRGRRLRARRRASRLRAASSSIWSTLTCQAAPRGVRRRDAADWPPPARPCRWRARPRPAGSCGRRHRAAGRRCAPSSVHVAQRDARAPAAARRRGRPASCCQRQRAARRRRPATSAMSRSVGLARSATRAVRPPAGSANCSCIGRQSAPRARPQRQRRRAGRAARARGRARRCAGRAATPGPARTACCARRCRTPRHRA